MSPECVAGGVSGGLSVWTRTWLTVVVVLAGSLVGGCQPPSGSTDNRPEMAGHSRVAMPTIPDLTVDSLRSQLGADYVVESPGPPLVLIHKVDPYEELVVIEHNAQGGVEVVAAHVVAPEDTAGQMDQWTRSLMDLASGVVGVTDTQGLRSYADVTMAYLQAGLPYGFQLQRLHFNATPSMPIGAKLKHIKFREGFVERGFTIMPGPTGGNIKRPRIPGASLEQLNTLLADFTVKASIPGDVILYARQQPTHTDYVVCSLNKQEELVHIEAFAANFQGDVDRTKLNDALWVTLAGLEYKDCKPQKAAEFLGGPKMEYAAGDGRDIGAASFWVPAELDGSRRRLSIFACDM